MKNTDGPLPDTLVQQVIQIDPDAQIRNSWNSFIDCLAANSCRTPDVIVGYSSECGQAIRQIKELGDLRRHYNYSPRPVYLAITAQRQPVVTRLEIERVGGYFLHLPDVPRHFNDEIERIRIELDHIVRSLPFWNIVLEGHGRTLQAQVSVVYRGRSVRVWGSERMIAALATFIKNNGIPRSVKGWLNIFADDLLFKPMGGPFSVPSVTSFKEYLRRSFPNCLQKAFDEYKSGFAATHVIECINPRTHAARYRIRGEWEVSRR